MLLLFSVIHICFQVACNTAVLAEIRRPTFVSVFAVAVFVRECRREQEKKKRTKGPSRRSRARACVCFYGIVVARGLREFWRHNNVMHYGGIFHVFASRCMIQYKSVGWEEW